MIRTCNTRPLRALAAALLLITLLSGCGGGDEGVSTASAATSAGSTGTAQTSTATSTSEHCGIDNFQSAVLAEINRRRTSAQTCGSRGSFPAAAALRWNDRLTTAALGHAQDMIAKGFFGHTGSNGSSVADRVRNAGYDWSTVAENIAAGQPTVVRVVDAWMNSEAHCANVMNATVEEVGIACVYNPGNLSNYWVMDLAKAL